MKLHRLPGLLLAGVLQCIPGTAVLAQPGPAQPIDSQEYFVRQQADESLLIRVNGFEAEFVSRVYAPEKELLTLGGVANNRLAPVFHYIAATEQPRQLDIEVRVTRRTNRTRFDIELSRMSIRDRRSEQLARAYRYLALGQQPVVDETAANWSVKVNSLLSAAQLFEGFGMEEMRLWSLYLAAFLAHGRLGDANMALDFTEQVLTGVGLSRFPRVELAATQLEGLALASLRAAGALQPRANGPDPVQSMLERAAGLAASGGMQLERAWSLYASGLEYAQREVNARALERYGAALAIAESIEAGELATLVRENMVAVHDVQGDVLASSEVLQAIESQLSEAGAQEELAENLLSQGRLLNRTYRYAQAIRVLDQALDNERNSVTRAQANLELAHAHYQLGQFESALRHARAAIVNPQSGEFRRPNPVIDVGLGLDILAGVQRARGDWEAMHATRLAQRDYLDSASERAAWNYQRGLDMLAAGGPSRSRAAEAFRASIAAAINAASQRWRHLSRLQLCVHFAAVSSDCGTQSVTTAHARLAGSGFPLDAVRADWLRANIQLNAGQLTQAAAGLDRLMDELLFLRRALPGVLGSWYWETRRQLFARYLAVQDRQAGASAAGLNTLLGLAKARRIEKTAGGDLHPWKPGGGQDSDSLRVAVARLDSAGGVPPDGGLESRVNAELAQARAAFQEELPGLTRQGIATWLERLDSDTALLTWHLDERAGVGFVLMADRETVHKFPVRDPAALGEALNGARESLGVIDAPEFDSRMEWLGARLLGPLGARLPGRILMLPAGPLAGMPLDALRRDGRYLAQRHVVVNLLGFPAAAGPPGPKKAPIPGRVFLAGDPVDWSGEFLTRLELSPQMAALRELFVGPGLSLVQGSALLTDEFETGQFWAAELVHLAMPGSIDLSAPSRSGLELSEPGRGAGRARLGPDQVRAGRLQARLVTLGQSRVAGQPLSAWDGRLGMVTDFLDSGAQAVVASLWPARFGQVDAVLVDFYAELAAGADVSQAMTAAKQRHIAAGADPMAWARVQVYTD